MTGQRGEFVCANRSSDDDALPLKRTFAFRHARFSSHPFVRHLTRRFSPVCASSTLRLRFERGRDVAIALASNLARRLGITERRYTIFCYVMERSLPLSSRETKRLSLVSGSQRHCRSPSILIPHENTVESVGKGTRSGTCRD